MARAAYLETRVLPKSGQPPALNLQCVRLPQVFLNRYRSFLFSCVLWKLGILESGNCDHFTGTAYRYFAGTVVCTFRGLNNVSAYDLQATES